MPIYGKIQKNILLQNKESSEAESWYIPLGTKSTVCCNDIRMTFDLFMAWSNLRPSCCGNTGGSCMAFADMQ